ncbi:MAG: hypothetical protein OXG37_07380 [Actinomycetia bacterium]|nr:hypothetical protein [Actinomycetes bacterium]
MGGHPDLADVTISGESAGDVFVRDDSFGTFVEETDVVEWPKLEIVVLSALVLADEAQARAVYEQMSTIPDRCAIEDFSSGDLGGSISELSFSAFGEDSGAFRIRVEPNAANEEWASEDWTSFFPIVTDYVYIRSGRVISMVSFISEASPLEQAPKEKLVGAVAGRMP